MDLVSQSFIKKDWLAYQDIDYQIFNSIGVLVKNVNPKSKSENSCSDSE
jgi:hypothetical protein